MHVAEPIGQIRSTRPVSESLLNDQSVLLAIVAAVTWLALIGAGLSTFILRGNTRPVATQAHQARPSYAVYELHWPVPTSFGSLTVTTADMSEPGADTIQVQVALSLSNEQDLSVDAPRLEAFRVVSTLGGVAETVPHATSAPATLAAQSTGLARLAFLAPVDGSVLWLEYRERPDEWPIRVALGYADQATRFSQDNVPARTVQTSDEPLRAR
ncbi:MAG TPA: hypothetical protein VGE94_08050 [Chloroflexota bacterium]